MPGATFLEGDSVTLCTVEEEDLEFLQRTINDPRVRRWVGNRAPINGPAEREWFESIGDSEVHLLIRRDDDPVGVVGLRPADGPDVTAELGIFLAPDHWGEGYGTEASRLVVDYAFAERRFHRVTARVFEGNDRSARIWEKLGFRHEATHREAEYLDGEFVDVRRYAVLEGEWEGTRE
jgi:RimJ/RimL family protein N-acetyltransferase